MWLNKFFTIFFFVIRSCLLFRCCYSMWKCASFPWIIISLLSKAKAIPGECLAIGLHVQGQEVDNSAS